ncbi:hypothetical protein MCOR27_001954 [Pyricularia oryzae]|uniref:Fatty acid hydroxylase domain-containing protein n=5 Tax=Pyricularia TaxID=48558 RepID=A0ABQ8NQH6_PYRGI|nr:uncharacterized protein MGG_06250 [Pyricularia oryzae 70-15]KAH8843228.1 hypothetical protein MCOR01_004056 [Pyricularia oryzae]KAI6300646.1 hypothetical protein MCOR33_003675 [Pyricularia grisea]EHA51024.1 hypothetical protein MGG_06250 [Pyricularia oryzae 70-15]KAH9430696.1 hypothetical protein MCOR02_008031 [Pyricularia oryzae]KAI6263634.1 hypothetical protein MCOR19_000268 [Pyricularia oryzae]
MVNSVGNVTAMANSTVMSDLPPLPSYSLSPLPDLLPFISDFWLPIILPHVAYWMLSLFFHIIDVYDLFPQYRLHTPDEITSRNHATRTEVLRDVLIQQVIQTITAAVLSATDEPQMVGGEDYAIAVWATRIRLAQRALPTILGVLGLNAAALSKNMASTGHTWLAGALAGGHYPAMSNEFVTGATTDAAFAAWELGLAKAIYWFMLPALQFWFAVAFLDTWQYFWHRLMHVNKWMYTNWHSRHHRLYVPYAYGALYNHPIEGFLLDTAGAGLAYKLSTMSPRMGMIFFCFSTIKTVDDHCGYKLPWDPLQRITSNNAAYHDIHHQSWGIKTNFSQPFFTIWDRWLNTMYKGDVTDKYERAKNAAANKAAKTASAKAQ